MHDSPKSWGGPWSIRSSARSPIPGAPRTRGPTETRVRGRACTAIGRGFRACSAAGKLCRVNVPGHPLPMEDAIAVRGLWSGSIGGLVASSGGSG